MSRRNLQKAFNKFDRIKKQKEFEVPAVLGFTINGVNTVEVGNRSGFVWARIRNNTNEVVQAFNDEVSPVYGLPVILIRDETDRTRYKVKSKDLGVYQNWNNTPYLPRHGNQHSFNPDAGGGGDVVFVYNRQFMPLAVHPSGSAGGGNVYVQQYGYYQGAQWKYAGGTGTASLLPYKPTGSTARMVLVYLDEAGNPQLSPGSSYFASSITGNAAVLPFVPSLGSQTDIPLAAIRLVSGTNNIVWDNIYDLRPLIVSDGFIPTGSSGHIIQDDGTPLAQQGALNFVGSNFAVYNTAGVTNVSGTLISTPGGGGGIPERSLPIYNQHAFVVTGTVIDFVNNLTVVASGSVAFVQATGGGGGGGTLPIFDDGVFKVSGTAINFGTNLAVTVSGTVAHVNVAGGSGYTQGARVYRSTWIAISGTYTGIIPFDQERWDTDNIHSGSSSQLYCNTAGVYLIIGNIEFVVGSGNRRLGILLNGTTYIGMNQETNSSSTQIHVYEVMTMWNMNVGDYVELEILSSVNTFVTGNSSYSPEFMMQRIG